MLSEKYSEAAVDVLDILDHMIDEDVQKVPKKFISILEECASKEYVANLDYSKRLVEMNLSGEAQGILGVMYRHYWCPIEKKEEFENKITENEIEFQKALREKYNPDEILKVQKVVKAVKVICLKNLQNQKVL